MKCFIFLSIFMVLLMQGSTVQVRYDGHKIYQVIPKTETDFKTLKHMQQLGFDFWKEPRSLNDPVHIRVSPHKKYTFLKFIKNMSHSVMIKNLQTLVDEKHTEKSASTFLEVYHTIDEINDYLNEITSNFTQTELIQGGSTYENRTITGLRIKSPSKTNKTIVLESGIHAREWIAPATALYLIDQIINSNDVNVRSIVDQFNWEIFPVLNADGYSFTWTNDRMWRKTRTPYKNCYGADPNRNWDIHWGEDETIHRPCSETYCGPSAFSEIEIKSFSDYLKTIDNLSVYFSFHSYSQLLMYPYGWSNVNATNYEQLDEGAKAGADAVQQRYGTKYTYGSIYTTIYQASGSSLDWVQDNIKPDLNYVYELRDTGKYGFLLPPNQIIPCGEEILDSIVAILRTL